MKYVILKTKENDFNRVYPVVFPKHMTHANVAENLRRAVFKEVNAIAEIVSAGFCSVGAEGFVVTEHGSASLRIAPNAARFAIDQRILNLPEVVWGIDLHGEF